jgi:hypothetical protein
LRLQGAGAFDEQHERVERLAEQRHDRSATQQTALADFEAEWTEDIDLFARDDGHLRPPLWRIL